MKVVFYSHFSYNLLLRRLKKNGITVNIDDFSSNMTKDASISEESKYRTFFLSTLNFNKMIQRSAERKSFFDITGIRTIFTQNPTYSLLIHNPHPYSNTWTKSFSPKKTFKKKFFVKFAEMIFLVYFFVTK